MEVMSRGAEFLSMVPVSFYLWGGVIKGCTGVSGQLSNYFLSIFIPKLSLCGRGILALLKDPVRRDNLISTIFHRECTFVTEG